MCNIFKNIFSKKSKTTTKLNMNDFLENNTYKINVSEGKSHYSQLNNQYKHQNIIGKYDVSALTMCNVTSICQSLSYNGWVFPKGEYEQPEDNLAEFILSNEEVLNYYKKIQPQMYKDWSEGKENSYPPNEIHAVLAFGVNKWLNSEADTFKENAKIEDIVNEIIEGRSCVISGKFPTINAGYLHHIVSLVGAEWVFDKKTTKQEAINQIKNNKINPNNFIIDDTYAFWNTETKKYQYDKTGNDVILSYQDFIDIMKPVGNEFVKYCHFLKSGTVTV